MTNSTWSYVVLACVAVCATVAMETKFAEDALNPPVDFNRDQAMVEEAGRWINRPGFEEVRNVSITCDKHGVCSFMQYRDGWARTLFARCKLGQGCIPVAGK